MLPSPDGPTKVGPDRRQGHVGRRRARVRQAGERPSRRDHRGRSRWGGGVDDRSGVRGRGHGLIGAHRTGPHRKARPQHHVEAAFVVAIGAAPIQHPELGANRGRRGSRHRDLPGALVAPWLALLLGDAVLGSREHRWYEFGGRSCRTALPAAPNAPVAGGARATLLARSTTPAGGAPAIKRPRTRSADRAARPLPSGGVRGAGPRSGRDRTRSELDPARGDNTSSTSQRAIAPLPVPIFWSLSPSTGNRLGRRRRGTGSGPEAQVGWASTQGWTR